MRLSLITHAENIARDVLESHGLYPDILILRSAMNDYLNDNMIRITSDSEETEFMEYLDYLIDNAKITVNLPKTRL